MQTEYYPWHQNIWMQWQQLLSQSRMHHGILLNVAEGSGGDQLVLSLAKTLLCKESETQACGICQSCQLFKAGTHADFHHIQPEAAGKQIGVDLVRQACQKALNTSALGGFRVIMIDHADCLTEAAANALLKTLEEPPAGCFFILSAASINRMLPTVVSRCNLWKSTLPDEFLVHRWLENELKQSVPLQVLRLNRGAPLAAKNFFESDAVNLHSELIKTFNLFIENKIDVFAVVKLLEKSQTVGLNWLNFYLLDGMKFQQGTQEGIVHCDELQQVEQFCRKISPVILMNQLCALNQLQARLKQSSGLNTELLLSQWLIDFYPN